MGRFLEQYARVELEYEVQHASQSVDVAFEPDGRVPEAPLGGWLGRIAAAGPGVLECFSHTVRADEVEVCIYKRGGLYLARAQRAREDGRPRAERPHLWLTTAGRPSARGVRSPLPGSAAGCDRELSELQAEQLDQQLLPVLRPRDSLGVGESWGPR